MTIPTPPPTQETADPGKNIQGMPFETAINIAFERLTSEIFVFLLAYLILVIGLIFLQDTIPPSIHNLLYILPIGGMLVYAWLSRQAIKNDPSSGKINLRSFFSRRSNLTGVKGAAPGTSLPREVSVGSLYSDRSTITGIQYGAEKPNAPSPYDNITIEKQYLLDRFQRLNERDRGKVIDTVNRLLKEQPEKGIDKP